MAYLEIACFNKESAIIANLSGADRIELCDGVDVGGTTPEIVVLQEVKAEVNIPVFVMIRPRGGDFCYTPTEYSRMEQNIHLLKPLANGFVFGILDERPHIDVKRNTQLVNLAAPLPCTFHRAFDEIINMHESLIDVAKCGFASILTSGGKGDAVSGVESLKELVVRASELNLNIIPGGGVRSTNLKSILETTGAMFGHSSAITKKPPFADADEVTALKAICRGVI